MSDEARFLDDGLRLLSRLLVGKEPIEATLQRIVDVADRAIPEVVGCSVTLAAPARTAVASNDAVRAIDAEEYSLGEGPCLAAIATGAFQRLTDSTRDDEFPKFSQVLRREHVGCALGVPLLVEGEVIGALNVYGDRPGGFGSSEEQAAQLVADQAAVVLANARNFDACGARVRQLQEALDTRVVIEQAKGVLMERLKCSPDAAFEALKSQSQRQNRKLRLVAADVVASVPPA
jgi:GAF domain-containing protein